MRYEAGMNVVEFEAGARRVRAARETRAAVTDGALVRADDPLAHFAAGTQSAVVAAQDAVLALMQADDLPAIIRLVTQDWPAILAVDFCALSLAAHDQGFRAGPCGIQRLPARRIAAWVRAAGGAQVRAVAGGSDMFGAAGAGVRTVGLVPLTLPAPLGCGLLALGAAGQYRPDALGGTEYLHFLGAALSRKIAACLMTRH